MKTLDRKSSASLRIKRSDSHNITRTSTSSVLRKQIGQILRCNHIQKNRTPPVHSKLQGQIHSLKGKGQPLSGSQKNFFEPRFGVNFNNVRIHTNNEASKMAQLVGARAFTSGTDIMFGPGMYEPGKKRGEKLIAHELTHVVQQSGNSLAGYSVGRRKLSANRVSTPSRGRLYIQRWLATEHIKLGRHAGVRRRIIIYSGDRRRGVPQLTLRFEDIPFLGDYFGSMSELRTVASTKAGQKRILLLVHQKRKKAGFKSTAPTMSFKARKKADTVTELRYRILAGSNIPHYAAGNKARNEYRKYHINAITGAFRAGQIQNNQRKQRVMYDLAMGKEAFGQHFLTDAFAAGHVRTPREKIEKWYDKTPPYQKSFTRFLWCLADHMAKFMGAKCRLLANRTIRGRVLKKMKRQAKPYGEAFSLGDMVARAVHDVEGTKLVAVRSRATGARQWETVGEGGLYKRTFGRRHAAAAAHTENIMKTAIQASISHIHTAYHLGQTNPNVTSGSSTSSLIRRRIRNIFAAEAYLPRAVKPSTGLPWKGLTQFNRPLVSAFNKAISGLIVPALEKLADRNKSDHKGRPERFLSCRFYAWRALRDYAKKLKRNPFNVVKRCFWTR